MSTGSNSDSFAITIAFSAVPPMPMPSMPGSGVALLGKVLSRHSKVHHLGALSPFSRLLSAAIGRDSIAPFDAASVARFGDVDFEALGREYLACVVPAAGAKELLVCESRPMNYQLLPLIARALPNARFLHMICGSPSMLADFRAILDARGFTASPKIGVAGHYVFERAFVEK